MADKDRQPPASTKKENASGQPEQQKTADQDPENVIQAHRQADDDIEKDADFISGSPNDDLDEGETARLGENNTGLV